MNIHQRNTIAFGDEENDLALFENVETAIAMGNGSNILKKQASLITSSNDEDGIYLALKKLKLIE